MSSGEKAGNDATSASHAGTEPTAPATDDVDELQHDIERTREHLGQTVGQLAAKADVKAVARGKATDLSERVITQVRGQVAAVGTPVWEATPEQVRNVVAKGAAGARRRRAPLAIGVGVLVLGLLIIRRWRGR